MIGHAIHPSLDEIGELQALQLVGVLVHLQQDVAFGAIGIEAVARVVIVFELDHGVLALGYVERRFVFADAEHVGLGAANVVGLLHGIAVQTDEKIGFHRIGDLRAALHRHEAVAVAGHHHLQVGVVLGKIGPQILGDTQRDVLLFAVGTGAARVGTAVAGVDHYALDLVGRRWGRSEGERLRAQGPTADH